MGDIQKYYKSSRKKHIELPLAAYGFKPYKSTYLARLTKDNVFQLILMGSTKYGGKIKVCISIRPLYCPNREFISSQPGNSIYSFKTKNRRDKTWGVLTENEIDDNLEEIYNLLKEYAIPFFDSTTTSQNIINSYKKNIFGFSKFGRRIYWGAIGWEDYDFGHIYLKNREISKAKSLFKKCYKEFKNDDREWAQKTASECLEIIEIIKSGKNQIDEYLNKIIAESKQFLKLANYEQNEI